MAYIGLVSEVQRKEIIAVQIQPEVLDRYKRLQRPRDAKSISDMYQLPLYKIKDAFETGIVDEATEYALKDFYDPPQRSK
jgi:hypothetical protein